MIPSEKEAIETLRNYLTEFKALTIKLIDCLEKEDYDNLEAFFNDRRTIIDNMDKLQYTKESFRLISNELQIMLLQQKLTMLMNQRKVEAKQELEKLSASKNASKNYNIKHKVDSLFFNKKI